MSPFVTLDDLDFAAYIRAGDQVVWGQVTGEPVPLSRKLMEQRAAIGRFSVFLGVSFSDTVQPHHADVVTIRAIGGGGTNRTLSKAGVLNVVPAHISSIPRLIDSGAIACDVALVQVTPSERPGFYEFAVASDYIVTAVAKARVVIGEVNLAAPRTSGPAPIPAERFTCLIESS
jgi:acyl-CoA hydrolase